MPTLEDQLVERITVRAGQLGGKPCIRGMRIRVSDVLGLLSRGLTTEQVLGELPDLEADDVRACLAYAAREMAREGRGAAPA
jgi:uncharacterized protein (DUF433 family)